MVVAAAGDVDHQEVVQLVEKHFSAIPHPKKNKIVMPQEKPFFCGSELLHRNDDMGPIAHVAVGFEGVPWKSPGNKQRKREQKEDVAKEQKLGIEDIELDLSECASIDSLRLPPVSSLGLRLSSCMQMGHSAGIPSTEGKKDRDRTIS